jgi:hypothetical protein
VPDKDSIHLEVLATAERPARMVGLFTLRAMQPREMERLTSVCAASMREEDAGASLTLSPAGGTLPPDVDLQRSFRITVRDSAGAEPHDCLVQLFPMDGASTPHAALLDHVARMDEELGTLALEGVQGAQTYLIIASGKLDEAGRIHAFQNLVSLFSSALGALIIDPAAAIVTPDPAEWADAMEMSLQLEKDMGLLRR